MKPFVFFNDTIIIKYILVGGVATIIDWSVFVTLKISFDLHRQFALSIAFSCGTIANYYLNKIFTFRCKSKQIKLQASTHLLISILSLLCSMGLMFTFMETTFIYLKNINTIDTAFHFEINKQIIFDHQIHIPKTTLVLFVEIICRMSVTLTMLLINFFMHKKITYNERFFK